jgi:hypothetical protein
MSWDVDICPCLTLPVTVPQQIPPCDPVFLATNILMYRWTQITFVWRQIIRMYYFHSRSFFPHGATSPSATGPPHRGFTITDTLHW